MPVVRAELAPSFSLALAAKLCNFHGLNNFVQRSRLAGQVIPGYEAAPLWFWLVGK